MIFSGKVFMPDTQPIMPEMTFRLGQAGMTLLELMISLSLGLLLVAGIGTIYVGSNQTYRVQEQNARIQESGRYALEVIGRSLRQAGYWNMPISPIALQTAFGDTPICGTSNTPSTPCAASAFTVRYEGSGASDCSGTVVATGNIVTETIDLSANNLRCNTAPLISNVEGLQFLYGIDSTGDLSADQYVAVPTAAQEPLIVSVRACILIRSEDQGITASAQRYLNCAGALGTVTGNAASTNATDSRLHRTFVATFSLRNRVR